MKLDRNINEDGGGKYALIKLRVADPFLSSSGRMIHVRKEAVDFGDTPETDFFVIRLKDKHAAAALLAYSVSARQDDPEYADEIFRLAEIAANHPSKQQPT